jgi:signal transduction histidine kinase
VAQVSHRLASGDLSVHAAPAGPPEVQQVGAGLNLLGARIVELLARERETVADLSHRLRTPLTVLRVDAESLSEPREMALVTNDVDALERTVNEIIREARRPVREGVRPACEAAAVVRDRAAFWSPLAGDQERWMSVQVVSAPVPVRVAAEDLATCMDTLLENVFAHTPEGTGFIVQLGHRVGGGGCLIIADDGPGFTDTSLAQRGISSGGSTGLGLDIVRRTAEASGGTLRLARSHAGGAAVIVELGPPVDDHVERTAIGRGRHSST